MNIYDGIREGDIDLKNIDDIYKKYYDIIVNFNTNMKYLSKCFIAKSDLSQHDIILKTIELRKKK